MPFILSKKKLHCQVYPQKPQIPIRQTKKSTTKLGVFLTEENFEDQKETKQKSLFDNPHTQKNIVYIGLPKKKISLCMIQSSNSGNSSFNE